MTSCLAAMPIQTETARTLDMRRAVSSAAARLQTVEILRWRRRQTRI